MKKLTAFVLALALCLSLCTVTAFATGTSYAITNGTPESAKGTNHGYITIDETTAAESDTVTVEAHPADGYQLKSLTATPVAPTISTIADVLATVEEFPASEDQNTPPSSAWVADVQNSQKCYAYTSESGGYTSLLLRTPNVNKTFFLTTTEVTPGENCYTASNNLGTLTFNMKNGILTSITFTADPSKPNAANYAGTYEPPTGTPSAKLKPITPTKQEDGTYQFTMPGYAVTVTAVFEEIPVTIADILPSNFPASDEDNSWCNSENDNVYIYKTDSDLVFNDSTEDCYSVPLSSPLTKEKNPEVSYVYSKDGTEIQFNMTGDNDDELENIVVNNCNPPTCIGTYNPIEIVTYDVTYNANGATSGSAPANQTKTASVNLTLATNTGNLAKAGYTFAGWNTKADGSGTHYDTGATYTTDAALTLYAEWIEAPATKTIADILPDDFPAYSGGIPSNAWKNSAGSKMYINNNNGLTFGYVITYSILSEPVTKDGNNYKYILNSYTITFVMDSDKLVKVITEGYGNADNNGEYIPTYTVTMGETTAQVAYDSPVTKPADPTRTGYTFGGWYVDENCTQAWNFAVDTVTEDMTLYAKWIANTVKKAAISGNVTENSTAVSGATVELFLGTIKVAATVTKDDPAGDYSFDNVENGVYNIVVTKDGKTKTEMVTVDTADNFEKDVELPSKAVSSVVEVQPEVGNVKSDISKTVVGGLDEIAKNTEVSGIDKVTIKLTVVPKNESEVASAEEIKTEAGNGKKVEFLDMSLWKQVNNGTATDIGDGNTQLLTIVIPFDFTGVDVRSVMILRNHGGNTEKLTGTANANGEYFKADEQAGTLTIYAKKFSTYAMAYAEQSTGGHGGGSYTPGHTVTSDLKNVTKVTVDGKAVDSKYYTVSGGNVTLTDAFMKTLANGKHTVKLYNGAKVATGIMTVSGNAAVVSAKTADAGIALYGVLSVSSLLGMGWVRKRKH